MKLIKSQNYKVMPWKNGQGVTHEIAREDGGADSYVWRLSQAIVSQRNEFSSYPGYERLLTVVSGEGLKLNEQLLLPRQVFRFAGEAAIQCAPLGREVCDLGLIFDPRKIVAEMSICSNRGDLQRLPRADWLLLFQIEGYLQFENVASEDFRAEVNDTWLVSKADYSQLTGATLQVPFCTVAICLNKIN